MPAYAIAFLDSAPVIDGRLGGDEWAGAVAVTGFRRFLDGMLAELQPVVRLGYDARALYLCAMLPLPSGSELVAVERRRDGRVYRDDALEILLEPSAGASLRQIVVNALGTVFDRLGGDVGFDGAWSLAVGQGAIGDISLGMNGSGRAWWLEIALPFTELGVEAPMPGEQWRINLCRDGGDGLTLAPVNGSFLDVDRFAILRFAAPREPLLSLWDLGRPGAGQLALRGELRAGDTEVEVTLSVIAEMAGTKVVEQTGFAEIDGVRSEQAVVVAAAAGGRVPLELSMPLADERIDRLRIRAVSRALPDIPLLQSEFSLQVRPPFRLRVDSYPTSEKAMIHCDVSGLDPALRRRVQQVQLDVVDAAGAAVLSRAVSLRGFPQEVSLAGQVPGVYPVRAALADAAGVVLARAEASVQHVAQPSWLTAGVGRSTAVLPPFEPLAYGARRVSMWDRQIEWGADSLLPSGMSSGGMPLLAAPIRLVFAQGGERQSVALEAFEFSRTRADRGEFRLEGRSASLVVRGKGWVEYDGLVWFDLSLEIASPVVAPADLCIEVPLRGDRARRYHAVPDRSVTGVVGETALRFPFFYYFWVGDCDRGLGFITESLEHASPSCETHFYDLEAEPGGGPVLWRITLLRDAAVPADAVRYSFGLQATPVKPLPPDYHSWVVCNYESSTAALFRQVAGEADFATIWNTRARYSQYFCDPAGVDTAVLRDLVTDSHARQVPALVYFAPFSFTDGARAEHDLYAAEWAIHPLRKWKSGGDVQTRACVSSSYSEWLLGALRQVIVGSGADGLYFDGALPLPNSNPLSGTGWRDAEGRLQPTIPVLAMREFMKRTATMLHEDVVGGGLQTRVTARRPSWPRTYLWTHISGAVCPPILSFNTAFFSGEWFKSSLRGGLGYEDLLTLDTFRPRYLSQPWGIPNVFLPITLDSTEGTYRQTEVILSLMLPHGTPLYGRYLNRDIITVVLDAMIAFGTRGAEFTPAFEPQSAIRLEPAAGALLSATWEGDAGVLAVIANCGSEPAAVRASFTTLAAQIPEVVYWPRDGASPVLQPGLLEGAMPAHSFALCRLNPR